MPAVRSSAGRAHLVRLTSVSVLSPVAGNAGPCSLTHAGTELGGRPLGALGKTPGSCHTPRAQWPDAPAARPPARSAAASWPLAAASPASRGGGPARAAVRPARLPRAAARALGHDSRLLAVLHDLVH